MRSLGSGAANIAAHLRHFFRPARTSLVWSCAPACAAVATNTAAASNNRLDTLPHGTFIGSRIASSDRDRDLGYDPFSIEVLHRTDHDAQTTIPCCSSANSDPSRLYMIFCGCWFDATFCTRFASFVLVRPALHASLFSVDVTHRARLFKRFDPHLACCLRGSYSSLLSSAMLASRQWCAHSVWHDMTPCRFFRRGSLPFTCSD